MLPITTNWNETKPINDVHYFKVTIPNPIDKYKEVVNTYYGSGQLKTQISQQMYTTHYLYRLSCNYDAVFLQVIV